MKKVLFLGIVIVFASSLGAIVCVADDVFWDRDKSPNATITDKDFKYKYGSTTVKSFGDQEIYDVEKNFPDRPTPSQVYDPDEEEAPGPVAPVVRPQAQPRRTPEPPARKPEVTPRQLDITPRPEKPASMPGDVETPSPPQPKLKWGKDASTPVEQKSDEKPKFQWGK